MERRFEPFERRQSFARRGSQLGDQMRPVVMAIDPSVQAVDGVCLCGMMDGSVRGVTPGIDQTAWCRLLWPNDGLVISNDN